jgi:two-component system osmolarity sensor histidine kinase EnvZ
MSERLAFHQLRLLAQVRMLWRRAARGLAGMLPKGLYKRSLLIVIVPMVLLQSAVTLVFMQHHWDLVTRRLSDAVARDVGALTDLYQRLPPGQDDASLEKLASERFRMDASLLPLTRTLPKEIRKQVTQPFWIDTVGRSGLMEIRVDLGGRVLRLVTRRALAYEANAHIFVLWMLGAMILLLTLAIIFLRNQIRPILRLANAAEDFGKGRDLDFSPHGAREVRQAGHAFIEMKRRVERATEQRTAMLNGVSHDLRTMLTRFKLSLALLDNSADSEFLQKDVDEMGQMLEGYLAFARGDTGESTAQTNVGSILEDLRAASERHGANLGVETRGDLDIRIRPMAMKRCVGNLVANAQRHAERVRVSAVREAQFVSIVVDDDGAGIDPTYREDVFRPFYRLDEARNQDEGGSGLGLAIARDIARSHGGDITLSDSPMGGLRAAVRIPV